MPYAHELRLLYVLLLSGTVFASAYALARRFGAGGRLQAACDALLLGYVVQYVSVALPGSFGLLNLWTMAAVALGASAACWAGARARVGEGGGPFVDEGSPVSRTVLRLRAIGRPDRLGFLTVALFVIAFTATHCYFQSSLPVMATDPLVYHLPEAVQWLQTGRLGLFDTWYWNPAATYSPATSSTFSYWLLAPLRNDMLARYVQAGPLLLVFFVVARLCRILGASLTVAGCVGAAAALCRSLFSQASEPKDDVLITAFFACAVLSLSDDNPRDRLGPWRAALAFGMVLASKYTVLLACPLFLFMADAPFRAIREGRRDLAGEGSPATPSRVLPRRPLLHWLVAVLIALALSMPWYLRTWRITGNPLFPVDVKLFGHLVFPGLFTTEPDQQLRTFAGVWEMLTGTYHSLPALPLVTLVLMFLLGLAGAGRSMLRDPLRRACFIGTPVTVAIFVIASPHHEVRYLFPLLPLMFAAAGFAIVRWVPWGVGRIAAAVVLLVLSVATSFKPELLNFIAAFAAFGAVVAVAGAGAALGLSKLAKRAPQSVQPMLLGLGITLGAACLMFFYVNWAATVGAYQDTMDDAWRGQGWGEHAIAWHYVRAETPPDATIAFANTAYIYPLYGFDYTRRVVYAPVRPEIHRFVDVPRLGDTVPGDLILDAMTAAQNANADRATWLANLQRLGADFVVIYKHDRSKDPPELRFATELPEKFQRVFEDPNAIIYRVEK